MDAFPKVGQHRRHARLQQYFGVPLASPHHQRRAMVRTLEARAFVAAGFQEPLLVGLLVVERAGGQQLGRLKWDFSELHRLIAQVAPLIHVMV